MQKRARLARAVLGRQYLSIKYVRFWKHLVDALSTRDTLDMRRRRKPLRTRAPPPRKTAIDSWEQLHTDSRSPLRTLLQINKESVLLHFGHLSRPPPASGSASFDVILNHALCCSPFTCRTSKRFSDEQSMCDAASSRRVRFILRSESTS